MAVLLSSLIVLQLVFLAGWWLQKRRRNAGHVDLLWAASVGITGIAWLALGEGDPQVRWLAVVLVSVWSARLVLHLLRRLWRAPEEGRYAALRQHWGEAADRWHLLMFSGQAMLAWLFALPFAVLANHSGPPSATLMWLAFVLGLLALCGETLADQQLLRFRRDPKNRGKSCRTGLWRYSRHPNYFFEWLHWLAYPLLAFGASLAGWLWLAPLLMFFFLWFVTGIPYSEQQALRSRGDDYRRYQQQTSAFFPWRPRHVD